MPLPDERGRSSDRLMKSDSLSRKAFNFDDLDDGDGDIESFLENKKLSKVDQMKKNRRNQKKMEEEEKNKNNIEMISSSSKQRDEGDSLSRSNSQSQNSYFEAQAEKHHRALIVGLLNNRAVWFGGNGMFNIMSDSWFFVCQYHPLLCIFLAHPSHPFQREERGVHLLAMLFFAFFIAALSELKHGDQSIFSTAKILWVLLSNFLLLALDTFMREVVTCSCIQPGGIILFASLLSRFSIFASHISIL